VGKALLLENMHGDEFYIFPSLLYLSKSHNISSGPTVYRNRYWGLNTTGFHLLQRVFLQRSPWEMGCIFSFFMDLWLNLHVHRCLGCSRYFRMALADFPCYLLPPCSHRLPTSLDLRRLPKIPTFNSPARSSIQCHKLHIFKAQKHSAEFEKPCPLPKFAAENRAKFHLEELLDDLQLKILFPPHFGYDNVVHTELLLLRDCRMASVVG